MHYHHRKSKWIILIELVIYTLNGLEYMEYDVPGHWFSEITVEKPRFMGSKGG